MKITTTENKLRKAYAKTKTADEFISVIREKRKDSIEDIREIVEYYKAVKGFNKIKKWDTVHFHRAAGEAKKLLNIFEGNINNIKVAIDIWARRMTSARLAWNMSTLVKHSDEMILFSEKKTRQSRISEIRKEKQKEQDRKRDEARKSAVPMPEESRRIFEELFRKKGDKL